MNRRDRIVLDEHRIIDQDIVLHNQSGGLEWRREIRFPIEMSNGEWLIGGISIDISELMRGKEERQRLISAIEQTGESVVITSLDGAIEYVNPAFETITGYTRREITGWNPRILKSGHHDKSVYKTLWDTILSGNRWTGRLINRRKDGRYYTSECAITPVKNNIDRYPEFHMDLKRCFKGGRAGKKSGAGPENGIHRQPGRRNRP